MLPVRYKEFKKHIKREYGKCLQLLQEYAMISTGKFLFTIGIRISCTCITANGNKSTIFSTNGSIQLYDNILAVYGLDTANQLIEFSFQLPNPSETLPNIQGMISKPSKGRAAPDRQSFFVNGRPCHLPKVLFILNHRLQK